FDNPEYHGAVRFDNARAAEAVDDQRFVRACLAIERREEGSEECHAQHHQPDNDPEPDAHGLKPHNCLLRSLSLTRDPRSVLPLHRRGPRHPAWLSPLRSLFAARSASLAGSLPLARSLLLV